jgi:hypothetical protein
MEHLVEHESRLGWETPHPRGRLPPALGSPSRLEACVYAARGERYQAVLTCRALCEGSRRAAALTIMSGETGTRLK